MNFKIVLLIVILLTACGEWEKPVLSKNTNVQVISNNSVSIMSYEIPKGIFRGILWPDSENKNFVIWIVNSNRESFFNISAPREFIDNNDITDAWTIRKSTTSKNNRIIYLADRKDGSKSLQIDLPIKKREYSFSVLSNALGDELLIFMDISEKIVDKGLFGYVIIKKN